MLPRAPHLAPTPECLACQVSRLSRNLPLQDFRLQRLQRPYPPCRLWRRRRFQPLWLVPARMRNPLSPTGLSSSFLFCCSSSRRLWWSTSCTNVRGHCGLTPFEASGSAAPCSDWAGRWARMRRNCATGGWNPTLIPTGSARSTDTSVSPEFRSEDSARA